MLEEMTLSNGRPCSSSLSFSLRTSALIASSPRTAYCTFLRAGLSPSIVSGRIRGCDVEKERENAFIDGIIVSYGDRRDCQKKKKRKKIE